MLAIRVLNGPQAGQVYVLKNGRNRFGRTTEVDFQLQSAGISKDHFEINVMGEKLMLSDPGSSNGTYLNGVRIKNAIIKLGDKLGAHNILMEVISASLVRAKTQRSQSPMMNPNIIHPPNSNSNFNPVATPKYTDSNSASVPQYSTPTPHPSYSNIGNYGSAAGGVAGGLSNSIYSVEKFQPKFQKYVEQVVMPAIYRLVEVMEFRTVIFGFAVVFLLLVTILSTIPMNVITQESILTESKRRALTIARSLASANERAIRGQDLSRFSTDLVLREDGLEDVFVVSKDGTILAPSERSGSVPKQASFIKTIRGSNKEVSMEIGEGYVGAAAPILSYDMDLQENKPIAHVIIIYNMGGLKFDDSRALGLFIQVFVIALIVGSILVYLMYKLIEHPFVQLNENIDRALKDGLDHTETKIQLPILQSLVVNINSMLHRILHGGSDQESESNTTAAVGLANLVQLFFRPAILLDVDGKILSSNTNFERHFGFSPGQLANQILDSIPDVSFQLSVKDLMERSQSMGSHVQTNSLDFSGHSVHIHCQYLQGFFFVSLAPAEESSGNNSNGVNGGAA